jgi:ankyrin repeat protein
MSFSEELKKSINDRDLAKFTELANHPALLVNEVFEDGLLHYLLKNPGIPLEFYKVVLDNVDTDVNKIGKNKLPPILSTENTEIQDLLLSLERTNVNIEVDSRTHMRLINVVLKAGDMELFKKLLSNPRTDYAQRKTFLNEDQTLLNYCMTNNMEAFKMLLDKGVDPNRSGPYNPVEYAVKNSNFEAFRMLLEKGAEFNLFFRARGISLMNYLLEFGFLKGSDMKMLDLVLDNYFDKIRDKKEFLEKTIQLDNVNIFQRLLEKGLTIDDKLLVVLIGKLELLKVILANPETAGLQKGVIVSTIYKSENMELVKLLGTVPFVEDIQDIMTETLLDSENHLLIQTIINSNIDYLQEKKLLPYLIVGKDGHMFDTLVQGGDGSLADILLELAPETQIPQNFNPVGSVIAREQYDLLKTLMTNYNVCLTKGAYYDILLKKGKLDMLKLALEKGSHCKLTLLNSYTFGDFYKKLPGDFAFELLFDDKINTNLWTNHILTKMYGIPGFTKILEKNIDRVLPLFENHVLLNIDWLVTSDKGRMFYFVSSESIQDKLNTPVVRILTQGTPGINILKRLLQALSDNGKRELYSNIVTGYLHIGDIETLELLVRELSVELNELDINENLVSNPEFMMSNIDTLLRLFPGMKVAGYISTFNECIKSNPQLFVSSEISRKLLSQTDYNYNQMVDIGLSGRRREGEDDEDYPRYTQLYDLCISLALDKGKTEKMDAYLFLIRTYLENPEVNINMRNDTPYDDESVTFLEYCALQIKDFDNSVDYSTAETYGFYQQVIKMILEHPSLDIDANRELFAIISREEEGINLDDLFTTILSNPRIDINATGALSNACSTRNIRILNVLLTIGALNVNLLDNDGNTGLHICIEKTFEEGAMALLADPRLDITIQDAKGRNYARLAGKAGMKKVIERLAELGQTDDKQARVEREIAEYNARMAAQGRVKQTRIRETLNSFDLILKEKRKDREDREDGEGGFTGSTTPYNKSMCPFCLTYIEKENPYECVYLSGHRCPAELENEPLKRLYFGEAWATKVFEICCVCGRPCEHHGHFRPTLEGEPVSELLPNTSFANHWDCNEGNGGGGKLEMTSRLIGMLSEIKRRVDRDERLVYGPELIRELAMIGNNSVRDGAIIARASGVLERQGWNSNSKIEKYKKFNAPNAPNATRNNNNSRPRNTREPIVHYDNPEEELQCMICLDEAEHLFKPHESDQGYICDECLKRQVCSSRYASVTCELGCRPKKQIYKEDVNALMGGNFCEGVEIAEAHANAEN